MPDEVGKPEEWFKIGERDLVSAKILLHADAHVVPTAVLLQQACEKFLKGFLISKGWRLRKTHDLRILVDTAIEYNADFRGFMDLASKLSALYLAERYPPLPQAEYTKEELQQVQEEAEKLINLIKRLFESPI